MHKKIDIYTRDENGIWIYLHSTNFYRLCREALAAAEIIRPELRGKMFARFAK